MIVICVIVSAITTIICSRIILEFHLKKWDSYMNAFSKEAKQVIREVKLETNGDKVFPKRS